jgi:hypothetical protein
VASYDEVIPPGQAGKVSATLKTEGVRGRIEKAITVTSNDPARPMLSLRVKAEVVGSVEFIPRPGLAFPQGMNWDWTSRVILRKDKSESGELSVTEVTPSVPWLKAVATKVKEPIPAAEGLPEALPGDYILEVTVTDEAPRTQGGFNVKMKTGLPREPEVTFPVSVVNQQPLRPVPNALYLQAPKANQDEVVATIEALLRPGIPKDQVVTATASPEPFTVAVEPDGPRKYKATVRWKPSKEARATALRQGAVVFHVGEESMTVPVRIDPDPPANVGAVILPGNEGKR